MSRSWLVITISVTSLGLGCSHQQKPTSAAVSARVVPVAAPVKQPVVQPTVAQAIPERPKPKEGDAIYFDFDSSLLRDDARPVLQKVAQKVRSNDQSVRIEGNCDEVGTVEYNLALGEQRARAARNYLMHMGVPEEHIATASYGSQRPKYPGHDEQAHAKNRRDDFLIR
jgi:peptidoglycan-associated lipoprotein